MRNVEVSFGGTPIGTANIWADPKDTLLGMFQIQRYKTGVASVTLALAAATLGGSHGAAAQPPAIALRGSDYRFTPADGKPRHAGLIEIR